MTDYDPYPPYENFDEDDELTAEGLAEALRGSFGVEAQAAAFEIVGMAPVDEQDEINDERAIEFGRQAERLENERGVPLTRKEIAALAADQVGTDPDVPEAYGRINNRDLADDDSRRELIREHMEDAGDGLDEAAQPAESAEAEAA